MFGSVQEHVDHKANRIWSRGVCRDFHDVDFKADRRLHDGKFKKRRVGWRTAVEYNRTQGKILF